MAHEPAVRVGMLGPLAIDVDGRHLGPRDLGGRKQKQLLEVLLVHRGEAVPKDRILELLWGRQPPLDPTRTVESYVSVLRRHLGVSREVARRVVASEPGSYRVPLDGVALDLCTFDDLTNRAMTARRTEARRLRTQALELVRGELLADEPYVEWSLALRDLYSERHVHLMLDIAEDDLATGDSAGAIARAAEVVRSDPTRERAHRILIAGHYVLGEQDRALKDYDRCRHQLVESLGVSPLASTERVYLGDVKERATNRQVSDPAAAVPCPARDRRYRTPAQRPCCAPCAFDFSRERSR